jgi:hypothetical protein
VGRTRLKVGLLGLRFQGKRNLTLVISSLSNDCRSHPQWNAAGKATLEVQKGEEEDTEVVGIGCRQ